MIQEIEYHGDWWIPGESKIARVQGSLRLSPGDGPLLELLGHFGRHWNDKGPIDLVLGETSAGKVTLCNCIRTQYKSSYPVEKSRYSARVAFVGIHMEKVTQITFNSVLFRPFNLFQWINKRGLEWNGLDESRLPVSYSKPQNFDFDISEACRAQVRFYYTATSYYINSRIELEERCDVRLKYRNEKSFDDIIEDIQVICGFITLATFEQSYPVEIKFTTKDTEVSEISCFFRDSTYNAEHKYRYDAEHLLKFEDVKAVFPQLMARWYSEYKRMRPVFNLLLFSFRNKRRFSEDRFVDTAKAVEIFHRMTTSNQQQPEQDFNSRIDSILSRVSPEDRDWLRDKLLYANEPTLRARIKDLLTRHQTSYIIEKILNPKVFSHDVVNSRNYYTHFTKDLEKLALRGHELYQLNRSLMGLLITCLFCHLGIDGELLSSGLKWNLR